MNPSTTMDNFEPVSPERPAEDETIDDARQQRMIVALLENLTQEMAAATF